MKHSEWVKCRGWTHKENLEWDKNAKQEKRGGKLEASGVRIQLIYSQLYSALYFLLMYDRAQVTSSSVSSVID